jgi:hypothetical protein
MTTARPVSFSAKPHCASKMVGRLVGKVAAVK